MRVLITGACGFVGRHLARRLRDAGDEVTGTWWPKPPEGSEGLEGVRLVEADVEDAERVGSWSADTRPEAIVHLAALSHVGESWERPGSYFRVNVAGTENVVRAAPPGGHGARVLIASSAEVYGAVPEAEQPIPREPPARPGDAVRPDQGRRRAAGPGRRRDGRGGGRGRPLLQPDRPRPGPRFALPSFASQLAAIRRGESEPVLRVGNLAARRDFVHVTAAACGPTSCCCGRASRAPPTTWRAARRARSRRRWTA